MSLRRWRLQLRRRRVLRLHGWHKLNRPVNGLVPTATNRATGSLRPTADLRVRRRGVPRLDGASALNQPVIGMVRYGNGYLMVASDGGIFDFSNKPSRFTRRPSTPAPIVSSRAEASFHGSANGETPRRANGVVKWGCRWPVSCGFFGDSSARDHGESLGRGPLAVLPGSTAPSISVIAVLLYHYRGDRTCCAGGFLVSSSS